MGKLAPVLRQATPADAPACARILQDWLDESAWMPKLHSLAETEGWMANVLFPGAEVFVAIQGGVVGFLALEQRAEVAQLVLSPAARGCGTGQLLLDAAKERAVVGLGLWCFEANAAALRFYRREGFAVTGGTAGDNEEGLPDLRLEWRRS